MEIIKLFLGASLLTLGRKLYWFFIAAIGFITGLSIIPLFFPDIDQTSVLITSFVLAILGAFLAIILQKFANSIAGFLAGAYSSLYVFKLLQIPTGDYHWIIFLAGGIIGIILVGILFDWALIILSTIIGASLISAGINNFFQINLIVNILIFLVLIFAGINIQKKKL